MGAPMTAARAHTHLVRPRWVWAALATSIAGLVALGIAVMLLSWRLGALGTLALAVGVLMGRRGGWLYDVHASRAASQELEGVADEDVHEGIEPGRMIN